MFWSSKPEAFVTWFKDESIHLCAAGGGEKARKDLYLLDPSQLEMGIKRRGGTEFLEVKGLVERQTDPLSIDGLAINPEIWTKWQAKHLTFGPDVSFSTNKLRWMRKFDAIELQEVRLAPNEKPIDGVLPAEGCNVELTQITDPYGKVWWSLGFESFGSLVRVESNLKATVETFMNRTGRPELPHGAPMSYPNWIAHVVFPN
ncbi:hypothetical protein JAO29_04265 [Edaphobacter sp. HDX4]|uniref:hypothetical protein n=1 Tax=Edaphobacter sp. HDX4 TaxID=2794064 RepID=UPI002FE63BBC